MSHPKELWEDTHMSERTYPIQLFPNRPLNKKAGDCVLYLHWHSHMELIYVREGHVLFHIDSQPVEAGEGDIVVVPGGSLHVGYSVTEEDVQLDCIVFNSALFHEWYHDSIHIGLLSGFLEGKARFPVLLSSHEEGSSIFHQDFLRIIDELQRKEAGYQLIVKARLYAWLMMLARQSGDAYNGVSTSESYFIHRDSFKQLLEWIKHNYNNKPTVSQAAQLVGLDPYYFCKQFKKLTGRTFIEYINLYRLSEAERLIHYSDASMGEIASQIGCENAAYFTKLYKQYMGMTPSQARKNKTKR